jgi:hypothetical protein
MGKTRNVSVFSSFLQQAPTHLNRQGMMNTADGERPTEEAAERRQEPTVIGPTEARQGEIILGRRGRILWIAVFVVIVLIVIASAIW